MTIFLRDNVTEDFVRLIPIFIVKRIREKSKGIRYKKMNDYMVRNYEVTIGDIINFLSVKGFSYNKVKELYTININYNIVEPKTNIRLDSLIRLIDYGNNEIRGIDLIDSSVRYITNNILNIYRWYVAKQQEYGDK